MLDIIHFLITVVLKAVLSALPAVSQISIALEINIAQDRRQTNFKIPVIFSEPSLVDTGMSHPINILIIEGETQVAMRVRLILLNH